MIIALLLSALSLCAQAIHRHTHQKHTELLCQASLTRTHCTMLFGTVDYYYSQPQRNCPLTHIIHARFLFRGGHRKTEKLSTNIDRAIKYTSYTHTHRNIKHTKTLDDVHKYKKTTNKTVQDVYPTIKHENCFHFSVSIFLYGRTFALITRFWVRNCRKWHTHTLHTARHGSHQIYWCRDFGLNTNQQNSRTHGKSERSVRQPCCAPEFVAHGACIGCARNPYAANREGGGVKGRSGREAAATAVRCEKNHTQRTRTEPFSVCAANELAAGCFEVN